MLHSWSHRSVALCFIGLIISIALVSVFPITRPSLITLERKVFNSVQEYDLGFGADPGHWSIVFCEHNTYTWHHSDQIEGGQYQYDPISGALRAITPGRSVITSTYDKRTKLLIWQGVQYKETFSLWHMFQKPV